MKLSAPIFSGSQRFVWSGCNEGYTNRKRGFCKLMFYQNKNKVNQKNILLPPKEVSETKSTLSSPPDVIDPADLRVIHIFMLSFFLEQNKNLANARFLF